MDQRIVQFISALRTAGVRISLAESEDAFRAIDQLGVRNRESFRISLRSTLVKDNSDIGPFEELFPLFFDTAEPPPLVNMSQDLSPEEAQAFADAIRNFKRSIQKMMEKLMRGEELSEEDLERLGQMVGLDQADDMRYREWMKQRMKQALRFREVREALQDLQEYLEKIGMDPQRAAQLLSILQANKQSISEQIDQFVGHKSA